MFENMVILIAIGFDLWLGEIPNRFHPVVAMGMVIDRLTKLLNKGHSTARLLKGFAGMVAGSLLFAVPLYLITLLLNPLPFFLHAALTALLLKPVFAFNSLVQAVREVCEALSEHQIEKARQLVGWHLVSRETSNLSERQVASAAIESLSENLTDSVLAPLFYFVIGGLPLAWLYRFVNTADAMIGYRTEELEYFGKFAARLDDVLNWLPARIAGFMLVLSAALTGLHAKNALRTMLQQHRRTSSPNAGWTMAAAAGALRVNLEKVNTYLLQGGDDLPTPNDIPAALRLVRVALIPSLLFLGGLSLAKHLWF